MSTAPAKTVMDEITDFIMTRPTPEEIIAFKLPDMLQQRAHELMDHNRQGNLTNQERSEMQEFMRIDHMMTLLKAKARLKLMGQE